MEDKQRIVFVSGKGGVGKSHIAATIATSEARSGRGTLLIELGEFSYFSHRFGVQLNQESTNIGSNLDAAIWSAPKCLFEYALHLIRIEAICRLFFENPISRTLINIAPSLAELAILGKVTSGRRQVGVKLDYKTLVIDAYASGHFEALLNAPRGMAEAVPIGPMGEQTRSIQKVLSTCEYFIVTTREELSVVEALELYDKIFSLTGVQPKFVLNRFANVDDLSIAKCSENEDTKRELRTLLAAQTEAIQRLRDKSGSSGILWACPEGREFQSELLELK